MAGVVIGAVICILLAVRFTRGMRTRDRIIAVAISVPALLAGVVIVLIGVARLVRVW
jgi:hypothetical protein